MPSPSAEGRLVEVDQLVCARHAAETIAAVTGQNEG
jgi:hypothetical protein